MDKRTLSIDESSHEHEMEIQDQDGQRLGTVWLEGPDTATGEEMAFGVELVRRWNAYPELLAALEQVRDFFDAPTKAWNERQVRERQAQFEQMKENTRAAIANATNTH